jgi:hypothetical protein
MDLQGALELDMQTDGDPQDPHCRFRSLITLLVLVTSFNNEGHPTLGASESTQGPLDVFQDARKIALNAFASVLVRKHEVIAVIANSSTEPLKLVAVQTFDDLELERMKSEWFRDAFRRLTAVANPRFCDTLPADCVTWNLEGSLWDTLESSLWPNIRSDE